MISCINEKQLDEIKPYFPLFKRYLFIQDDRTEERLTEGLREYFKILENNLKFVSFLSKFITFLVKLCNRNRGISEFLASCPDEWDWIIDWMKKNPLSSKSGQQYKNYTRETAITQYRLKRLQEIKAGNIITYEDEYDSDDDTYSSKHYKGKKLDVRHFGQVWTTGEVIVSLDEMVSITYTINNIAKALWLPIECDELAPHMAMQSRHDILEIDKLKKEIEEQHRVTMQHSQNQEESANHSGMNDSSGFSHEGVDNDSVSD